MLTEETFLIHIILFFLENFECHKNFMEVRHVSFFVDDEERRLVQFFFSLGFIYVPQNSYLFVYLTSKI